MRCGACHAEIAKRDDSARVRRDTVLRAVPTPFDRLNHARNIRATRRVRKQHVL
jgi:hypothetical protein